MTDNGMKALNNVRVGVATSIAHCAMIAVASAQHIRIRVGAKQTLRNGPMLPFPLY